MHPKIQLALDPNYLGLIILPTEKCNFRCTYCYEDFDNKRIDKKVVDGIKKLLSNRSSNLKMLNIEWFGGEPLLTKDILFDILYHARNLEKKYGFLFSSSMTTNGYLLDRDMILNLSKLGITCYQISFDGFRDYHNIKRFINHPKGSFDRIWKNINTFNHLRAMGDVKNGKITLRLHLHSDNQSSLLELADLINKSLDPKFFNVFIKNIAHLGGKNDKNFEAVDNETDYSVQRHNELNKKLIKFQKNNLMPDELNICYAAMPNTFVIRSDGSLAKCTVALKNPKNHLGYLTQSGTFDFDSENCTPWLKSLQTNNKDVLACPLPFVNSY